MTVGTISSPAADRLVNFTVDETPFSSRVRGLVFGLGLLATTTIQTTPPAHVVQQRRDSSTRPASLPQVIAWDQGLDVQTLDVPTALSAASEKSRASHAVEAVERISAWLNASEESVAELVHVARGSVRNWRTGQRVPYPATIRRLMEVDAILSALRSIHGDNMNTWLRTPDNLGLMPLDTLRQDDGPAALARAASSAIFESRQARLLPTAADFDDIDSLVDEAPAALARPFAGMAKPRRPKK